MFCIKEIALSSTPSVFIRGSVIKEGMSRQRRGGKANVVGPAGPTLDNYIKHYSEHRVLLFHRIAWTVHGFVPCEK